MSSPLLLNILKLAMLEREDSKFFNLLLANGIESLNDTGNKKS